VNAFAKTYAPYLRDKKLLFSIGVSLAFLLISLYISFYAATYATEKASAPVTDLILNRIPVFDVDGIFIYGPVGFWIFVGAICLRKPERIPFVLKSIALFTLIRSVFIILTHIGPFPDQLTIDYSSKLVKKFTLGGDLFFSGHTGLPFLMALIFRKNIYLYALFIASAIFFGAIVLMAHLHYSIDVLAAFFITFSIYHMAASIFKKDKQLFDSGLPASARS